MDENLISKKDLLNITGISYGQLYRWKRKNIIPEEWFIKKSSFTGQETFFPKEDILERIKKIKNMKDGLSLDELAEVFSPRPKEISITREELINKGIISEMSISIYEETYGKLENFEFDNILYPYILETLLKTGEISYEEGKRLIEMLNNSEKDINEGEKYLVLIRKLGIGIWIVGEFGEYIITESSCKIIVNISIKKCVEELKVKLEKM